MSDKTPAAAGARSRAALLLLLYVAQALPLGFFVIAMPAILRRQGAPLEQIGLLGALALPFLLKFLWAPWVDRYGAAGGHYRSWLLPLQVAAVALVAGIALLDPATELGLLLPLGALFMMLAATQDVATDGLAVRLLPASERGLGNGIQVGGYYLGQILGGGVALVLIDRFGWTVALGAMAAILALPLPLVALLREPAAATVATRTRIGWSTLAAFFRRDGIGAWVAVLATWRLGETMAQWMLNPLLVDRGYSLETIGLLLGVLGSLGALAGALLGTMAIRLGRQRALGLTGWLVAPALALYLLPAAGIGGLAMVYAVVIAAGLAGGAATAVLYTSAMDASAYDTAGTDFTIQQSLAAFGPMVAASISGLSAATLGYTGHFGLAVAVQVLVVGLFTLAAGLRRELDARAVAAPT